MTSSDSNWALLRHAVRIMDEQRLCKRERVRKAIKASTVPMPEDVVRDLAQLNSRDARDVLRDHPGFPTWEKLRSYETSFEVFNRSVEDLLRAIQKFSKLSRDETLFERRRDNELNNIQRIIQKELFAAVNAAHALVDHSTHQLQKSIRIPDYDKRLAECFMDDGLHDFVIGLRSIIHHVQMIRAGWLVTQRLGDANLRATFMFERDELLFIVQHAKGKMKRSGRRYLESTPENIDLGQLIDEYRRRTREFHFWFSDVIKAQRMEDVRDYERCLKENKSFAARTWWKAMLGNWLNWDRPPNPYKHLDRYLTPDQVEEVYRLPMGSTEQVDKVIEFVDTDGACDDELRHLAYQLFRRADL